MQLNNDFKYYITNKKIKTQVKIGAMLIDLIKDAPGNYTGDLQTQKGIVDICNKYHFTNKTFTKYLKDFIYVDLE
jgi:hypothetical protein